MVRRKGESNVNQTFHSADFRLHFVLQIRMYTVRRVGRASVAKIRLRF
jgi:hypothetical protein